MLKKAFILGLGFVLAVVFSVGIALAADPYPSKTIKMVVPYAPGGRSDILARVIGKYTKEYLGQEMVVVNLAGASGTLGCRDVLAAKPDGYSLLYHHQSMLTSYHTGLADFNYNSFVPVARMAKTDNVYLVKPDSPWNSFKDMAEAAKKKPGSIRIASSVGSPLHLSFVIMQRATGNAFQLAAGGGGDTDRITKLLGGHIEVTSASLPAAKPYIDSGKLKPIFLASKERSRFLPQVQSWKDSGLEGNFAFDMVVYAPPGTPENVVKTLASALKKISENKTYIDELDKYMVEINYLDTKDTMEWLKQDDALYAELTKAAGLTKKK